MTAMKDLTPYDSGDRLEPHPSVRGRIAGTDNPRLAEPDDYGRVDFENEEAATVLSVVVERDGDGYRVVVHPLSDLWPIVAEVRQP